MVVKTIDKWVNIKPSMLGDNFLENLQKHLESIMLNICNEKYGHILKVIQIHKVKDNYIANSSSDIMVYVTCSLDMFNPADAKGETINSKVCAIYESGILVDVYNIQKILIPLSSYSDKYLFDNGVLVGKSNKIHVGDTLDIKITATKYDNHKFSCIGVIV